MHCLLFYLPGIYYGMTIFIVSFATAMTVLTLNIHHKGSRGYPVPMIVKKVCFELLAKMFCMTVDTWNDEPANLVRAFSKVTLVKILTFFLKIVIWPNIPIWQVMDNVTGNSTNKNKFLMWIFLTLLTFLDICATND